MSRAMTLAIVSATLMAPGFADGSHQSPGSFASWQPAVHDTTTTTGSSTFVNVNGRMPLLVKVAPGGHFGAQINLPKGTPAGTLEFKVHMTKPHASSVPIVLQIDGTASATNISAANISAANISAANISAANISAANISAANISRANISPTTPYPTNIYTLEYDGFADFPQYPINLIADLNALAGIFYVHGEFLPAAPGSVGAGPGSTIDSLYIDLSTASGFSLDDTAEIYIDDVRVDGVPIDTKILTVVDPKTEDPNTPF